METLNTLSFSLKSGDNEHNTDEFFFEVSLQYASQLKNDSCKNNTIRYDKVTNEVKFISEKLNDTNLFKYQNN